MEVCILKEQTALFIGHGECYGVRREDVSTAARELIEKGVKDFLCGGMGDFDWIAAGVVYELKAEYPDISVNLVIPYWTFNIRNKELFNAIIYPEGFEKYHFKAAILQRNRYMVKESAHAICYVTHSWGGAAKTFEYAKKQGLYLINLGKYD